jgi:hypothetical protein
MQPLPFKTAGRWIVSAFILLYAIHFMDGVFFPSASQYRISGQRCMTAPDLQTNRMFFRASFDVQAPKARVFMKIVVKTHAFIYLNGSLVKTIEARPIQASIVDLTRNIRQGENLLALKVQNRQLKTDSAPRVSATVFMVDGSGNAQSLLQPADWKGVVDYPVEKNARQWYQRQYPDDDWKKVTWQTARNNWGGYSPFPLSVYRLPVSGKRIAVSGGKGRTVLSYDFTLPASADNMVIRLQASEACVLMLNKGAYVDIRPLEESVGVMDVKRFLKKVQNQLSLIFQEDRMANFLVHALYLDSSGHCVGGFSSDETWHCSRPQGIFCLSDVRDPGHPLKIMDLSVSFESRLREWLWKAGGAIAIGMLIACDLCFFRKKSVHLEYTETSLVIRCYYIYLLPLVLMIFMVLLARDYRIDQSLVYSIPVFMVFPVWICIQRILSFR